jgi:hypothetical protein
MDQALLPIFILAAFPIVWFLLVCFVLLIVSFTGWRSLAEKYAHTGEEPELSHRYASAQISWFGRYNHVLNLAATSRGLYIRPILLFRFAHPALLLPWHLLVSARSVKSLFKNFAELQFLDGKRSVRIFAPEEILKNPNIPASALASPAP